MQLNNIIESVSLDPEWYKGFMSDCPEGKLNTESFMKIYSKCFPQGNAAEFCDHVFRWEIGHAQYNCAQSNLSKIRVNIQPT